MSYPVTLVEQTTPKEDLSEQKNEVGERILEMMGTSDRYQYWVLLIGLLVGIGTGFIILLISYLAPEPTAECPDSTTPEIYNICSEKEACNLIKLGMQAKVYFDIDSWTKQYDMICDRADERELSLTLVLIITSVLGTLGIAFSDIYGRVAGIAMGVVTVVLGASVSILVDHYLIKMIGLGILTSSELIFSSMIAVYSTEITTVRSKYRTLIVGIFFFGFGIGSVAINIVAYISTSPNFLIIVSTVIQLVGCLPAVFFYESPMFKLDKGEIDEFESLVAKIARVNKRKPAVHSLYPKNMATIRHIQELIEERKRERDSFSCLDRYPICQLFSVRKYFWSFLLMSIVGSNYYWCFYGLSTNLSDLGLRDIRVNGIIYGATQGVGYLAVIPYLADLKRKYWTIVLQFVMVIGTAALFVSSIFMNINEERVQIGQSIVSCVLFGMPVSAAFTIFYIHMAELYPPEVRATANSLVMLVANLASTVTPFAANYAQSLNMHFMIGCGVVGLLSLPLSFCLRETLTYGG